MTTQERDAWTFAYRLYDEYVPKMIRAVALDDDNKTAGQIFMILMDRIKPHFTGDGNNANFIYMRVYDLIEDVFKEAQRQHKAARL